MLVGTLQPSTDSVVRHPAARIACLGQEVPTWEPEITAQDLYDRPVCDEPTNHLSAPLVDDLADWPRVTLPLEPAPYVVDDPRPVEG